MARPILRLKTHRPENAANCPQCDGWLVYQALTDSYACAKCDYRGRVGAEEEQTERFKYPSSWIKGQLLNVRRSGDNYILTLMEEEFDPQQPERALIFNNSFDCQALISWWYNKDTVDPRAG